MKKGIKTVFYLVLSILGLSYLSLLLFVGAQLALGKITAAQLVNMLRVLDGQRFYTLPSADFDDFEAFKKSRDDLRARTNAEFGPPDQRAPGAAVLEGERRQLEESLQLARRELLQAKEDVLTARREVERLQAQVNQERALFASQVAKEAAAIGVRRQAAYPRIVQATDAATLGEMLSLMPPDEAAEMMRDYIPPETGAEILPDLPNELRLRILPLVKDQLGGMAPRDAADYFARRREIDGTYAMGPLEIYQNLRGMNSAKALAILLLLPDTLRAEVERYARNPPPL